MRISLDPSPFSPTCHLPHTCLNLDIRHCRAYSLLTFEARGRIMSESSFNENEKGR